MPFTGICPLSLPAYLKIFSRICAGIKTKGFMPIIFIEAANFNMRCAADVFEFFVIDNYPPPAIMKTLHLPVCAAMFVILPC